MPAMKASLKSGRTKKKTEKKIEKKTKRKTSVSIHPARAVHVWTADPEDVAEAQWPGLASSLDAGELSCASRFAHQADARAYVLAHALRRLAVSAITGFLPAALVFASESSGQPVLVNAPAAPKIWFSHARRRSLVACAVTGLGPVGIDVELVDARSADMGLLSKFMVLPDAQDCQAGPSGDQARQFFFYWTTLEAYWKSRGRGLSFSNPAITCRENRSGWSDIMLSAGADWLACGRAMPIASPAGTAAALVLDACCFQAGQADVDVIRHQPAFLKR